jgi:hypothetical protein
MSTNAPNPEAAKEPEGSKQANLWFVAIAVLALGFHLIYPEFVKVNGGFGWDGFYVYKKVIKNWQLIFSGQLDSYQLHHFIPYQPIGALIDASGGAGSDETILLWFRVYQNIVVLVQLVVWALISKRAGLSRLSFWMGFSALFFTCYQTKMNYFNAVLGDSTALLLGLLSLYFYIGNQRICLLLTSVVGLFSWPSSLLFSLILLAIPYKTPIELPSFLKPLVYSTPALLLGLLSLYFYIGNQRICLLLTSVVGLFSWPSILIWLRAI